ncbi:LLM class flavin-dependent oxidoreductase [Rhodococcus sp. Z13]|uniref:LLM class flavin-dependent oxidoreductase n=1 Tax=Rhodococcus sacchari TaxID=2962047 RepID=A0ACD4DHT4_9NOCA|nr:LLM class flavin-dependent oxidoreductase [Rhodococcus sp. Z13]UYP19549.1 LLM class flavin-dependent oxidoreductase [Rhodococcus sp. Z13]
MKFGIFSAPYSHAYANGKRTAKEVIDWDLQMVKWADEYDLDEAFFAEHYTLGGEPSPAPDAMIAAASQITSRVRLGAAAHLLPYHNPIALAHRMMWLDHMTDGRYIAGIAPGAYASDAQLFGTGNNNPKMMVEALDILEAIFTRQGPYKIEGEYFSVDMPAYSEDIHGPHLKPRQTNIPLMITGMSENSSTIKFAGERGAYLLSQEVHEKTWINHWETYSAAATAAGREVKKSDWRVCRDIFVADTDEEALDLVRNGAMGELWGEYNLPNFVKLGLGPLLTGGQIDVSELSLDWMIENFFIIGSPDTVAQRIEELYNAVDGFGTLVTFVHEYTDNPEPYRRSFELLGQKVKPQLAHLNG